MWRPVRRRQLRRVDLVDVKREVIQPHGAKPPGQIIELRTIHDRKQTARQAAQDLSKFILRTG